MSGFDPWKPTDDKEIGPNPTSKKLKEAEDLFDFTLKEKRELFGAGNKSIIEAGLCDGQTCVNHKIRPDGLRGCTCRFARPDHPNGTYFRDRHQIVCTQNGDNEVTELGCKGFKSDPDQRHDRKKPAYMQKVYANKVIPRRVI